MEEEKIYLCLADIAGIALEPETVIETPEFTLTNSPTYIFSEIILNHQLFFQKFGEVQTLGIVKGHTFLISAAKHHRQDFTHFHNNMIAELLHQFWRIRDNSIFASGFFYLPEKIENPFLYSRLNFNIYNSLGSVSKTKFTKEEIESTSTLANENQLYLTPKSETPNKQLGEISLHTVQESIGYNEMGRMERALGFIFNALKLSVLPIRITNYISFLECLFSSSGSELSHQVSERVAIFLHKYNNDLSKIDTYKFVKDCYTIRSKYVHGAKLENKHKELNNLQIYSQRLDNICRSVLNTIIAEKLEVFNDDKNIDQYFLQLIFE